VVNFYVFFILRYSCHVRLTHSISITNPFTLAW